MKTELVICSQCSATVLKPAKEVTRSLKLGRKLFCNLSCASSFGNKSRTLPIIPKLCEFCKTQFSPKSRKRRFCSVKCGSKGSVTVERRAAAVASGYKNKSNLGYAKGLKAREAWKYVELVKVLTDIPHEFEYNLSNYVFDLALFDRLLLIEFDGIYHRGKAQQKVDAVKDEIARINGFSIHRIRTDDTCVIPSEVLSFLS